MKHVILGLTIIAFTTSFAQRYTPSEENISAAKQLQQEFEEENLVVIDNKVLIEFDFNRSTQLVEATLTETNHFLNIGSAYKMQYPVFYDTESEVGEFIIRDHRKKFLTEQVHDEHLKRSDLFHTDYRVKYVNLNFPLQGSERSVTTQKTFKDVKYLTSEYFSDNFRVQKGSVSLVIPPWLDVEVKEFNFDGFQIEKKISQQGDEKVITYQFQEIPPMLEESYTPGPSYLYPHIIILAQSFTYKETTTTLFSGIEDLYGWYNSLVENVPVKASVYQDKVDELIANCSTDEEKARNIYYWVQDNIRYIAFEDGIAGFQPDSPQNVFEKRYGDCKGMAILTKSMLEAAGLEAYLVWIGTDRLAYDYSFPSLAVDNHMIAALKLNDRLYFLDATEKYSEFGQYASRISGREAMVKEGEHFKIVKVPTDTTQNLDHTQLNLVIQKESIQGVGQKRFEGESKVAFQNFVNAIGKDVQEDALSHIITQGQSNVSVKVTPNFDASLRGNSMELDYVVEMKNNIAEFDGTLYIDLDPSSYKKWDFSERKNDYLLPFEEQIVSEIHLALPESYKIIELPKGLQLSNDLMDLEVSYEVIDKTLTYKKRIQFKKRTITKSQFDVWNDSFSKLNKTTQQQIILQKN